MPRVSNLALSLLLATAACTAPAMAKGPPRPDLKVVSLSASAAGGKVSVSDAVRNAGRAPARRFAVGYYLSADAARDAQDAVLGTRTVRRLRAGGRSRATVSLAIPPLTPGGYRVIACADRDLKVRESSERNNCRAAGTVEIHGPPSPATTTPPVVTPPPAPTPDPTPAPTVEPTPEPTPAPTPGPSALRLGAEGTTLAPAAPAVTSADFSLVSDKPVSKAFTATTLDAGGKPLADVSGATSFLLSPSGQCAGTVCGGAQPGEHLITGTYEGLEDTLAVTVAPYEASYTMTCRGERYDTNATLADGCERTQTRPGHTTAPSARHLPNTTDCDGAGGTVAGSLHSDARAHTNPEVAGFDAATGSAPSFLKLSVSDQFGCVMDQTLTIRTTGGSTALCYRLSASWSGDMATGFDSFEFAGQGEKTYMLGGPSDHADVTYKLERTCSKSTAESIDYELSYHY